MHLPLLTLCSLPTRLAGHCRHAARPLPVPPPGHLRPRQHQRRRGVGRQRARRHHGEGRHGWPPLRLSRARSCWHFCKRPRSLVACRQSKRMLTCAAWRAPQQAHTKRPSTSRQGLACLPCVPACLPACLPASATEAACTQMGLIEVPLCPLPSPVAQGLQAALPFPTCLRRCQGNRHTPLPPRRRCARAPPCSSMPPPKAWRSCLPSTAAAWTLCLLLDQQGAGGGPRQAAGAQRA